MRQDRRNSKRAYLLTCAITLSLGTVTFGAGAQVHRCVDRNGKVQFSNMGCPADTSRAAVDTRGNTLDMSGMRAQNQVELAQIEQRRQRDAQASAHTGGFSGQDSSCPSEKDISNMRVSAGSISLQKKEREFHNAEIRRAEACRNGQGSYTAEDWKNSKTARDDQRSISLQAREDARRRAETMHSRANPEEGQRIVAARAAEAEASELRRQRALEAGQAQARAMQEQATRSAGRRITACDNNSCTTSDGERFRARGNDNFGGKQGACWRRGQMMFCN